MKHADFLSVSNHQSQHTHKIALYLSPEFLYTAKPKLTFTKKETGVAYQVGIVGATGYVGGELVRILSAHPDVELSVLTSNSYVDQEFSRAFPQFKNRIPHICQSEDLSAMANDVDVIFCALPHGHAAEKVTPAVLEKARVIDLGSDFRLKNLADYPQWYNMTHAQPDLLKTAVYGLPEWNREAIRKARLIANPGCYPTCSTLALAPLLRHSLIDARHIIIDAKSGVSGAGRALGLGQHYAECNESIKAYAVTTHRHTPEIEQTLQTIGECDLTLTFTPHLIPMNRGILATIYAPLNRGVTAEQIQAAYAAQYANEPFIRLLPAGSYPETRWVKGSNFCDIAFAIDARNQRIVIVAAIDNLVKGAAGQAVQNMNLMLGLDEQTGLHALPIFPA
jgi:N-acetyl-gamma-glutamyl-phosphate reductase